MPRDDDDDLDPEAPDASDTDDGDGDLLDPCPKCRKLMYDDSEQCPHCGHYVEAGTGDRSTPPWVIFTAAVVLIGGAVVYFGGLL